jgi:hypothetical protein
VTDLAQVSLADDNVFGDDDGATRSGGQLSGDGAHPAVEAAGPPQALPVGRHPDG